MKGPFENAPSQKWLNSEGLFFFYILRISWQNGSPEIPCLGLDCHGCKATTSVDWATDVEGSPHGCHGGSIGYFLDFFLKQNLKKKVVFEKKNPVELPRGAPYHRGITVSIHVLYAYMIVRKLSGTVQLSVQTKLDVDGCGASK